MTELELKNRLTYLAQQIDTKRLAVERALAELESTVKQYVELEAKYNEIKGSEQ